MSLSSIEQRLGIWSLLALWLLIQLALIDLCQSIGWLN